jgi:hypothetical protein
MALMVGCVALALFVLLIMQHSDSSSNRSSSEDDCFIHVQRTMPPLYWINMNTSIDRSVFFRKQLQRLNVSIHERVSAVDDISDIVVNQSLVSVLARHNPNTKVLRVIASHLKAIYLAVSKAELHKTKYAIVMEDDARLLFDVDFDGLLRAAPKGFGMLQLATSNNAVLNNEWRKFTGEKQETGESSRPNQRSCFSRSK